MEATFRAHGCARATFGLFLLIWLTAWAAGELFLIRVLRWALEGGWESVAVRSIFHPMGWLVGGFVLLWGAAWTYAGVSSAVALLRLLGGEDRLNVTPDGWTISKALGPFRLTKHISQSDFRDVFLRRQMGALVVETPAKDIEVTSFGTVQERRAIVDRYRRDAALDELPRGWTDRDGTIRSRAGVELRVRRGGVTVVKRSLGRKRDLDVEADTLELTVDSDSDGDEWVTLRGRSGEKEVILLKEMNDERTVLRIARRIAKLTGTPITVPHVLKREAREL